MARIRKSGMSGPEIEAAFNESRLGDYPKDTLQAMGKDLYADYRCLMTWKANGSLRKPMTEGEIEAIGDIARAILAEADSRNS